MHSIPNLKATIVKVCFFVAIISLILLQFTSTPAQAEKKKKYTPKQTVSKKTASKGIYTLIKWDNLLPERHLKALQNGPSSMSISEGGASDKITSSLKMKLAKPKDAYEKALVSVEVRKEYNNKKIKLPGFIVPIDVEGEGITKKFFFVPFFGACLHLPPPPPNQIIYASFPKGYKVTDLYEPYYIEATLYTKKIKNDMATAAYVAKVHSITEYVEPK